MKQIKQIHQNPLVNQKTQGQILLAKIDPSLRMLIGTLIPSFVAIFNGFIQWIGLRENLQETMVFPTKYRVFLLISLTPIL